MGGGGGEGGVGHTHTIVLCYMYAVLPYPLIRIFPDDLAKNSIGRLTICCQ